MFDENASCHLAF
ncbi:hypothetical protein IJ913_02210 [bacterium]|nr:hypothetical protein [bacterium]